ncbi:hypothetical protein [Paenilisteria newyorkensis]|uniref:hypothetical protein n=1 Tax=Listeria newyorkensis TaxID=1497681 RepID=UPI0023593F7B|nr:hypothetical protein [Listeria newyorkensis]WAO22688.1 hypothetical protein OTR81_05290 [Listeria newyorkensis]
MKKDGMKIEIIQDESGLAVPRQYIVVVDHQIFMEWLDYPNKPIFLIPAHVPNVRIDWHIFSFSKRWLTKRPSNLVEKSLKSKKNAIVFPKEKRRSEVVRTHFIASFIR